MLKDVCQRRNQPSWGLLKTLMEEVVGQAGKLSSEVALRAVQAVDSSFWPSLWLQLPLLDLAETPLGRLCATSACLCKNATHGPSSQPGANHVI